MSKRSRAWIIGVSLCLIAPSALFSLLGPSPLTLLLVCTISGVGIFLSTTLEKEALEEKNIDLSQGSKTGNALAKALGIIMLLVIVFPILLSMLGVL